MLLKSESGTDVSEHVQGRFRTIAHVPSFAITVIVVVASSLMMGEMLRLNMGRALCDCDDGTAVNYWVV